MTSRPPPTPPAPPPDPGIPSHSPQSAALSPFPDSLGVSTQIIGTVFCVELYLQRAAGVLMYLTDHQFGQN
jgi:hypothetical protein